MVADTSTANSAGKIHASRYLLTALLSAVVRCNSNRQRTNAAFRCVVFISPSSLMPKNFGWAASQFLPVGDGGAVISVDVAHRPDVLHVFSSVHGFSFENIAFHRELLPLKFYSGPIVRRNSNRRLEFTSVMLEERIPQCLLRRLIVARPLHQQPALVLPEIEIDVLMGVRASGHRRQQPVLIERRTLLVRDGQWSIRRADL